MGFILLLCIFVSFNVEAEIFYWLDAKGNKNYSDRRHQGAETFQINPGYSFYQVKKVYDGDTVLLANGQKVRLLGINTPEVEGRNKTAQAGGEEAKRWLTAQLKNQKVRLETGLEKKDKYGRLLAHLFTEDKQHINFELVKNGLATVNMHPPNLKYSDALLKAQRKAEKSVIGIWKNEHYQPKQVININRSSLKGWQRVIGQIQSVHHSRKYSYLNFSDTFGLKIDHKSMTLFPDLESYIGKNIEARGWINKTKKRYSMLVRHPSALSNL